MVRKVIVIAFRLFYIKLEYEIFYILDNSFYFFKL